jgi:alpha-L-rhamnosidase
MIRVKQLIFFLLTLFQLNVNAQSISSLLIERKWNAQWIATEKQAQRDYTVSHFRKSFQLTDRPASFIIHVSADNRYKLFVNGVLVSLGPARSDLYHWKYETVDIGQHLKVGKNVIASVVWNFGSQRPLMQFSLRTAFIVQGNTATEEIVNTNSQWKCFHDTAYTAVKPELVNAYYVMGPGERVDYNLFQKGWEQIEFNDELWLSSVEVGDGLPKGVFAWEDNWMLLPSTLPQMELTAQRFHSLRQATNITLPKSFLATKTSFTIPAKSKVVLLLDQGALTNAYPVVEFSKGKGSKIILTYAEALYINEGNSKPWKDQRMKGNRNEIAGKNLSGRSDEFIADGSSNQKFVSLDFRTFRYVKVEIETADEPLIMDDLSSIFTGYPFKLKSTFDIGSPTLTQIFNTGWHTARLCATETYMDCPYYEQLQYVGDTRIQCMVSMYNSGDDRLVRNAITQIDNSRLAEGITQSRYPSSLPQHIPTFSLWWIGMLSDYYRYGKDPDFVKQFLPGVRQVLWFFKQHQQQDGRLNNPPYWQFTDWTEKGGWRNGMPPIGNDGCAAPLDLQLLLAYQTAAALEKNLGMNDFVSLYNKEAALLQKTIREKYWDETKQLVADNIDKINFSQHTNTLAIITGLVQDEASKQLALKIVNDTTLTEASIYFKYYVNQALAKAGLGDTYLSQLDIWEESLKQGLTTWPEESPLNTTRSDCHAWGASPNIEFFRIVLGIDSDAAGFSKIKIEPHLGTLKKASGTMPHPQGEISVSYQTNKKGKWQATLAIPQNTTGSFIWHGQVYPLQPGVNTFSL